MVDALDVVQPFSAGSLSSRNWIGIANALDFGRFAILSEAVVASFRGHKLFDVGLNLIAGFICGSSWKALYDQQCRMGEVLREIGLDVEVCILR